MPLWLLRQAQGAASRSGNAYCCSRRGLSKSAQPGPSVATEQFAARKAQWHRTQKGGKYVDTLQVRVKGGQGGDGCIAFAREKFKPFGPPSGSGGGQGGSVQLRASLSVSSLSRLSKNALAERGTHGTGDWQSGRKGQDKIIDVPVGTVVRIRRIAPDEEREVLFGAYEDLLRRKYRNAYRRQSKVRRKSMEHIYPELSGQEFTAEELRSQRDAYWRYYAGAMGHGVPSRVEQKEGVKGTSSIEEDADVDLSNKDVDYLHVESLDDDPQTQKSDREADKFVEKWAGHHSDLSDAGSDIRPLGRSFQEAERRLAFMLLDREADKRDQRRTSYGNEDDGAGTAIEEVVDLDVETVAPILLAQGGHGGMGNAFFASAKNRSPTMASKGAPGEEAIVHLEWKFKGDVGLIGLPNAGKSTFLKAVCATGEDVRVAGYAFTTVTPNIGVVRLSDRGLLGISSSPVEESLPRDQSKRSEDVEGLSDVRNDASLKFEEQEVSRFILQDLPGLVRGASENRGLGHDFLRHIERCLALYYVVDVSDAAKAPWEDVKLVHSELELYRKGLSDKVRGIIANKCDAIAIIDEPPSLIESDEAGDRAANGEIDGRSKLQKLREEARSLHNRHVPVWNVSAKYRIGVENTARAMARMVNVARKDSLLNKARSS